MPSAVVARLAKMSRIRLVRSITLTPRAFSRFFCWEGPISPSTMARSTPSVWQDSASSWALPLPIKVAWSGWFSFCSTRLTITAPAVSASALNSSRLSCESMEISITFSASSTMPPAAMACATSASLSSISLSQLAWGRRPGFKGPKMFTESFSYSSCPKNAAVRPVQMPSDTPMAHMESKRNSRSASMSTWLR